LGEGRASRELWKAS